MDRRILVFIVVLVALASVTTAVLINLLRPSPPEGTIDLETIRDDLEFPVSLAFTPDGRIFYNELRAGRVRILQGGELQGQPFLSLEVVQQAETGLLGLAIDPDFTSTNYVYLYYTYDSGQGIFNRISRFKDLGGVAGTEEVLLDRIPANSRHNGGRLVFGPDGKLYASVGDTLEPNKAQDPSSLAGKILRMEPDGSIPLDNPVPGSYTYVLGVRNVFGMDFTPSGLLVFTENGPAGGDEVNLGFRGSNHGWPIVTGFAPDAGYEEPLLVFTPSIAPTGVAFYTGQGLGGAHADTVYFGSWNDGTLIRLRGDVEEVGASFTSEVVLTTGEGGVLDVVDGPDGHLYVSTPGGIFRVILTSTPSPVPATLLPAVAPAAPPSWMLSLGWPHFPT